MNYPVTLIIPAGNVGAVEAGKHEKICMGMWIRATYTEPFTLWASMILAKAVSIEDVMEVLRNEQYRQG